MSAKACWSPAATLFISARSAVIITCLYPTTRRIGWNSDGVEAVPDVAQQVAPVFDTDRDAHQAVGDAGPLHVLGRQLGVGRGLGVAGERLDAAETDRVAQDPERAQEGEGGHLPSLQVERHDPSREIALRVADADLLRVGDQGRVEDAAQGGVPLQALGDALGVLALPV